MEQEPEPTKEDSNPADDVGLEEPVSAYRGPIEAFCKDTIEVEDDERRNKEVRFEESCSRRPGGGVGSSGLLAVPAPRRVSKRGRGVFSPPPVPDFYRNTGSREVGRGRAGFLLPRRLCAVILLACRVL